jgi:hypothetical protein
VFVSPNYHRIHHRLRGPQDVNLGFTLTIWDQLTRRAVFPTTETISADTGLLQRPLRVEQQGSRPRHLSVLAAQLIGPFRPMDEPIELASIREPLPASDEKPTTIQTRELTSTTAPAASEPLTPQ